jgi:radical SAM enzyme (TIGR01210 family)
MNETLNNTEGYQKAKYMLAKLNRDIKALIPSEFNIDDFEEAGHHEIGVGCIDGNPIERVIIILKGCGCEWARKEHCGCTMCGHLSGSSNGKEVPVEILKKQFETAINEYDFRKYPMLCLYNGGSFLNEREIPTSLRRYMLKRINSIFGIKRLIIESRAEYINNKILDEIETLLPNIVVEIGVGVETANDTLRNLVLNKGVTTKMLVDMGKKFCNRKTKLLAYVLVNPPFLTESEAIADTVNSIGFAAKIGASVVSLEAVSIQHLTCVAFLAEAGFYKTPWIWSMFEIVKQTQHLGLDIRIGGFEFFPIPKEFTSNCLACNENMITKIQEFNRLNDVSIISNLSCINRCDLEWKKDLERVDHRPLPERIISTLEAIDIPKTLDILRDSTNKLYGIEAIKIKEVLSSVAEKQM